MPETIDGLSMNVEQANMDKLKAVFPECFAEGKLDIDKLLGLCGEYIDNDLERKSGVPKACAKAFHGNFAPLPRGERKL